MVIRPYHPNDWQRLCEIHDAARLDELACTVGVEAFKTLEQAYIEDGLFDGSVDVALIDSVLLGFIAYTDDEITWLYVAPDCYRRGVGRALVERAVDAAPGSVSLEVLEGNHRALALYRALGFTEERRVEGQLSGNEAFAATGIIMRYTIHEP